MSKARTLGEVTRNTTTHAAGAGIIGIILWMLHVIQFKWVFMLLGVGAILGFVEQIIVSSQEASEASDTLPEGDK